MRELLEQIQAAHQQDKLHKETYTRKHERKPKGDGLPVQMLYDAAPDVRRVRDEE